MLQGLKKQINLVIKDRVLRYVVTTGPSIDGIIDYGEVILKPGILEDGKLLNQFAFQNALNELVKEKKWKNKSLSFCVPDMFVTIREHLVPKELTKEEIKSYIYMELEESIRLPFSNPAIDFVIVGDEDKQSKILLFAYPKEKVMEFVKSFEKTGLKPKVADLSSLSLYRIYYQLDLTEMNEHLLSIQWDKDATLLTAFSENRPVFTRNIKSTLNRDLWEEHAQELSWSGNHVDLEQSIEDQLITIERFMDFYQYSVMEGQEQISKILLTGDFPLLKDIKVILNDRLNLPVQTMDALEKKWDLPGKFADVIGLSIKNGNK